MAWDGLTQRTIFSSLLNSCDGFPLPVKFNVFINSFPSLIDQTRLITNLPLMFNIPHCLWFVFELFRLFVSLSDWGSLLHSWRSQRVHLCWEPIQTLSLQREYSSSYCQGVLCLLICGTSSFIPHSSSSWMPSSHQSPENQPSLIAWLNPPLLITMYHHSNGGTSLDVWHLGSRGKQSKSWRPVWTTQWDPVSKTKNE